MGVRADLQTAPMLALVHVRVHVAHDRKLDVALCVGEAWRGPDIDHLMDGRRQWDRRPRHPGEARTPHAARDHDGVGLDVAARGPHAAHAPMLGVDAEHFGVREDREGPRGLAALAHDRACPQRVDDADARGVEAADDHRLVDERDKLLHFSRRQQRHRGDTPGFGRRHTPRKLLHPLLGARNLDPARLCKDAHLLVLADALERERGHFLGMVDRVDEVGGVPGRASGVRQRALVNQQYVRPPLLGQVVRDAVAHNAAADHDRMGCRGERAHAASLLPFTGHP